MNLGELMLMKYPNQINSGSIQLGDRGNGPEITVWDTSLGPIPTQADLDAWALELEPIKYAQDARQARREAYPAIGDQLDMLYKAMDAGVLPKVPDFYNSIKAVKTQFPTVKS